MPFAKGHVPWNKSLTKETDARVKKNGESISKTKRRKAKEGTLVVWNKCLTKEDARVAKSWKTRKKNDPKNLIMKTILRTRKRNDPFNLSYKGRADKAWITKRNRYGKSGIRDLEKFKQKCRRITKNWWNTATPKQREDRVHKVVQGYTSPPTKPEQFLIGLFEEFNLPYEYHGDHPFPCLEGLKPDFVHSKEQKIIEYYGDYYHRLPEVIKKERRRMKIFEKHGYKVLILSGQDLNNVNALVTKVEVFSKR